MYIEFKIPGAPQGKARARTFYNSKMGRMNSITPEKTVLYENLIKMSYLTVEENKRMPFQELMLPLKVSITACFEPPKSVSKKNREKMLKGEILPTKKPDIDNIAKVVLDALNGIAYKDDTQVVSLEVRKIYSEEACVKVYIHEI